MFLRKLLSTGTLLGAALLLSCDGKKEVVADLQGTAPPAPAAPTPEVRAALEAQPVGKKLLGNTRLLVGSRFVPADLRSAPELYIVHFSASW